MSGAIYQPESYEDGADSSTDREMISKWAKNVDRVGHMHYDVHCT